MRLSTSTLGCQGWDLPTLIARLTACGFDAVDFRGLLGEMRIWKRPEFSTDLAASARLIRDAGLAVSCLSTGVRFTDTEPSQVAAFDDELARSAGICAALGCRQMRIFGGDLKGCAGATEAERPQVIARSVERVRAMAERVAAIAPVDLLIETHDAWTCSAHLKAILEQVDRPDVACCWDVKHTWWMARETAQTTCDALRPWLRNTHWKDVRRDAPAALMADQTVAGKVRHAGLLVPVGDGSAPLADACELLLRAGYDGWWTLEWEKHWHPHIAEAETVFPAFVRQMQAWRERFVAM